MLKKSSITTEGEASNEFENVKYLNNSTLDVAKISKRLRGIPPKYSSLSGIVNISSFNKSIQFESSLERDFILFMEFNNNVIFFFRTTIRNSL